MAIIKTSIFTLKAFPYQGATFYRLECPDWINIIPLTKDNQVVMVRQYRHGIQEDTLEIPGGQMDKEDNHPLEAAKRELREETGYGKGSWETLGWVHPNPAIFNNLCHLFLAKDVEPVGAIQNDPHEHTEVELVDLKAIPGFILQGRIRHGLVINAFSFLALRHGAYQLW